MKRWSVLIAAAMMVISAAQFAAAQETRESTFTIRNDKIWTSFEFVGRPVTGSPYSADSTTESTQVLADGNRIVNTNAAKLYRDSQGRTRREQSATAIVNGVAQQRQSIFINDPVAGVNYVLDPDKHAAQRIQVYTTSVDSKEKAGAALAAAKMGADVGFAMAAGGGGTFHVEYIQNSKSSVARQSLGTKTIEGVEVEGTRETSTIPAGQIGNERPIEIVSETWYSPKLQAVVMSTRIDPRTGTTTYRLENINLTEPPQSFFEVPADYTIRGLEAPQMKMERRQPE